MGYTRDDRLRLALETGAHDRTVTKWLRGEHVSPLAAYALRAGARVLGIQEPPSFESEDTETQGAA